MELRQYLVALAKWIWLIALSVVIAAGSSYLASKAATPLYRTKTTLMIGRVIQNPDPTSMDLYTGQQLALTYIQLVRREPVLQGALDSLGLTGSWQSLAGQVSAAIVPQTQLIEISVIDASPERAMALADAIGNQLVLLSPSSGQGLDQESLKFTQDQIADLETKIKDAQAEADNLRSQRDASISARQIQDLNNQISLLDNKISGWQYTYSQLLLSVQGGDVNAVSVVEKASEPRSPISPNVMMNVLTAAAIGLVLAVGGALLIEYLDDTVKTPDDVTRLTGLPTLGAIAKIQGDSYPDKIIALTHPRSPIVEAYRVLRTNIQYSSIDHPIRTLMVTSPGPGEGKSVSLANLAVVMAQGGMRVILVDTDLRRPVQHRIFGLSNQEGASNALLQPELITNFLQPTANPNLRVLTSGPLPPNPAEFLGSERMDILIEALKAQSDMVLFDTPPTLVVADPAVMAAKLDGVILVNESGKTRSDQSARMVQELKRVRANLLGVVLNQLTSGRGGYGYYYYYYEYADDGTKRSHRKGGGRSSRNGRGGNGDRFTIPFLSRFLNGNGSRNGSQNGKSNSHAVEPLEEPEAEE